jgi:transcriptional regulator with XRE-family HTH domain
MVIGERIQHRLDELGLSQAELARRVKLRQSTINGLVRGEQRSSTHLHVIARELKTSTAYLSGETNDPEGEAQPDTLTSQDREALELIHRLDPANRKALFQVMRCMAQNLMGAPGGAAAGQQVQFQKLEA